jgi:hypothetical protein
MQITYLASAVKAAIKKYTQKPVQKDEIRVPADYQASAVKASFKKYVGF